MTVQRRWTTPVPDYARDMDCRESREPEHIGISYCPVHEQIELWLDKTPYILSDAVATQVADALLSLLVQKHGIDLREEARDA